MVREPTTQIRDILTTKVRQAKEGDLFALLDLESDATPQEIKQAYFRLARLVHPDSLQKQSLQDRKADAAFVFERVTQAYQTLIDPRKREAYLRSLEGGGPVVESESEGRLAEEQAKIALYQGKTMLNRRAYSEAEKFFKQFTELKPNDARGFLFLGWCLFQNKDRELNERLEEARAAFKQALKLDEFSADAHYYLALYYKEKGMMDQVRKHLKAALELKKDHVPALREQRLLDMRGTSDQPGTPSVGEFVKGLFSRFGKKKEE